MATHQSAFEAIADIRDAASNHCVPIIGAQICIDLDIVVEYCNQLATQLEDTKKELEVSRKQLSRAHSDAAWTEQAKRGGNL